MSLQRYPLIRAVDAAVLGSGLQPDMHQLQKVLWEEAENVYFMQGRVRRRKPSTEVLTAGTDAIRGIAQQQDSNGVRWLWAASGADVIRWYGPSVEAIYSAATWTEDQGVLYGASFFDFTTYGDWMLLNHGHGQPRVHKPGTGLVTLSDYPSDIVALGKYAAHMLAFGYSADKNRIGWSTSTDIEVFTATEDNDAGALSIQEFDTAIRARVRLAEGYAVLAEDQMAYLTYVGFPFYFGYKMRIDGIGAVGKRAVATDGTSIVGVGRNGIWWSDGFSYRYIDEGPIKEYLQERVNWAQATKIVCVRNDVTNCFEFSFPVIGGNAPAEAWGYDPRVGAWYPIPVFSDKDERRLFDRTIEGGLDGKLYFDTDADEGNPLVLKTKPMLAQVQSASGLVDLHQEVQIDEIDLLLKEATGVEWRIGSAQRPEGPWEWMPWTKAEVGAATHPVRGALPAAPYHALEFRSVLANWSLDLQGFQLYGTVQGMKLDVST